jgi:hypothetical protein
VTRRKRTVIVLVLIELLLAGGWAWPHYQAVTSGRATADAPRVIGQTFGAAMGLILALSPFLYRLAARNDKRQSPPA